MMEEQPIENKNKLSLPNLVIWKNVHTFQNVRFNIQIEDKPLSSKMFISQYEGNLEITIGDKTSYVSAVEIFKKVKLQHRRTKTRKDRLVPTVIGQT